jgi:lipoate-protein ligase A
VSLSAVGLASFVELPLRSGLGAAQMRCDEGLLAAAAELTVRRYVWDPPAVSLGKFQELGAGARATLAAVGLDVVRRPSGGRLVLHGTGFEWSFAVVWPAGALPYGTQAPYRLVSVALAGALADLGVVVDAERDEPYTRSALCFASALRHDLLVAGEKAVAVAQAVRGGRALVHGSVLERRPPVALVRAVETASGEPWRGEGLAAGGVVPDAAALWAAFVGRLAVTDGGAAGWSGFDHDAPRAARPRGANRERRR